MTEVDVTAYRRDGYVVLRDVLSPASMSPFLRHIERYVEEETRHAHQLGVIPSLFEGEPVERRMALLHEGRPLEPRSLDRLLFGRPLWGLLQDRGLVGALTTVLGPDVTYQGNGHLRAHLPGPLDPVPWHQDAQFYGTGTEHMRDHMAQVWIPLADAPADRGCLAVVPGSHRNGILPLAVPGDQNITRSTATRQELIYRANNRLTESAVLLPMEARDIVVFSSLLLHTGTENVSDVARWSIDVRFEATLGSVPLSPQQRSGYDVMHRRTRGRGYVPLRISSGGGPGEDFETWEARREAILSRAETTV